MVVAIDAKYVAGQWKVHLVGGAIQPRFIRVGPRSSAREKFYSPPWTRRRLKKDLPMQHSHNFPTPSQYQLSPHGGAGEQQHLKDAFLKGKADAALAASVFHFNTLPIPQLKAYLNKHQIPVRL